MKLRDRLRNSLFVLVFPLLWWVGSAFAGNGLPFLKSGGGYEFIEVSLHASHAADYAADVFTAPVAAIDPDIITDALQDADVSPEQIDIITKDIEGSSPGNSGGQHENGNGEDDSLFGGEEDPGNSGASHDNGHGNDDDIFDDIEDGVDELLPGNSGGNNGLGLGGSENGQHNGQDNGGGNGNGAGGGQGHNNPVEDVVDTVTGLLPKKNK